MAELAGLRALVVEDEGAVALLIEGMLEDLGCEVALSASNLAQGLRAAAADGFDFAVLDLNLDGQLVFPVAEVLRTRLVPFVFSTGFGRAGLPETFQECEVLSKPFTIEELERRLLLVIRRQR